MTADGAGNDAVVALARETGRIIIDATGNGRPTRWERISASLHIGRPLPDVILRHPTLTSGRRGVGSIVARFERAGSSANGYFICAIGFYDEADRPRPMVARIDCEVLGADDQHPWPSKDDALDALARVGRLVHYGETEDLGIDAQGVAAIVFGDSSRVNTIQSVCKLALVAADLDEDAELIIAHPAPGTPVNITLRGDSFELPERLDSVIRGLLNRNHQILRVECESDDTIRIMRCYTSVRRGAATPVQAIAALRDLERHFSSTGIGIDQILPCRT